MSRVGQARRRDANEAAIVRALRQVGALVIRVSEKGAPDLLVTFRGKLFALEVKSRLGRTTMAQDANLEQGWPVSITRTEHDALKAIGAICRLAGR